MWVAIMSARVVTVIVDVPAAIIIEKNEVRIIICIGHIVQVIMP
jgi:hypothetical protein